MKDQDKTKEQLINELAELRKRNDELEKSNVDSKRVEEELKSSEEKYRDIVDLAPDGMVTVNLKGTVTSCNPSFLSLSGYSDDEIIGKHFTKLPMLHLRDVPKYIKMFNSMIRGKSRKPFEVEWTHKNGTTRQAEVLISIMRKGHKIVGIQAIARDITKRKQAEEALHESEEKFRLLSEQNLMGIIIIQDGLVKYVNKVASQITEYPIEEALDWKPNEFGKLFHPDDQEFVTEQAQKKQEGAKDVVTHYSYRIITKTGKVKWIDQYSKTISLAEKYADLITIIDITERKKGEDALRESEQSLTVALKNAPMVVAHVDKDLRYTWIHNPHPDFKPEDVIGKRDDQFAKTEGTFRLMELKRQVLDSGIPVRREISFVLSDGERVYDIYAEPKSDRIGKIIGLTTAALDITERKNAERFIRTQAEVTKNMAEGAYIVGLHDVIIRWANPRFEDMFGYEPGEMIGRHASILNAPTDLTPIERADAIMEVIRRTGEWHGEVNNIKKDGTLFWCNASVSTFTHPEFGEVLLAVHTDITERKRAEEQLMKSQEELQKLAEHLQTVREEERTQIARELHDDIGQSLAALKIDMYLLGREIPKDQKLIHDRLESFMELTDKMTDTVGAIYTGLRPPLLDELGLKGVVGWYQREFEKRVEMKCDFQVELEGVNLSDHFSLAVFRILQESLTNVRLHSEATRVKVILREKDGELELIVKDNGIGISEEQIEEHNAFGIMGMEERVRHLGGDIKIKGIPGKGTTVIVRIPLQSDN